MIGISPVNAVVVVRPVVLGLRRLVGRWTRRCLRYGRANGPPGYGWRGLLQDLVEVGYGRGLAEGGLPHQTRRRELLVLDHLRGGAVGERLTRLTSVVGNVLVYVVDVVDRGRVGRAGAVVHGWSSVLQGAAAARRVGRTRLLVAASGVLQGGVGRGVAGVVVGLVHVHLGRGGAAVAGRSGRAVAVVRVIRYGL